MSAPDPGAAVESAAELLDTFRSRVEIGQRHFGAAADNFRPHHRALVVGLPAPVQLSRRRQVELFTLSRTFNCSRPPERRRSTPPSTSCPTSIARRRLRLWRVLGQRSKAF